MSKYGTISSLAESPQVEGLVYAGTDDGLIHVTDDGGQSWRKIASLPGVPDGFFVNDNGLKFIQVQALERSGLGDPSIPWPGGPVDPELRFAPLRPPFSRIVEGRLQASYSPVFAALSRVPFRAFGFAGLYLLPLAGALLTLWVSGRLAERACPEPHMNSTRCRLHLTWEP